MLERDCDRLIRNDRVIWSSCMVANGDADAMITGNTRRYSSSLEKIVKVVDPRPGEIMFGLNLVVNRGKTIFICDTSVIEYPDANQLADMAISASRVVKLFGFDPKVAFLSHSTFGQPITDRTKRISDAVKILKKKQVEFKFDGEMQPDVALEEIYKDLILDPATRFVGVRGIMKKRLSEGDTDTALKLAEKAFSLKPKHEETQDVLLSLQTLGSDWGGARKLSAQN